MGAAKLTADLSAFRAALRKVKDATKKAEADIVNSALKDVALMASSYTPKITVAKIRGDLRRNKLAIKLAILSLNRHPGKGKWTKQDLKDKTEKIIAARTKGSGVALRSGWFPAAIALGAKIRGARPIATGTAAMGKAKKATTASLSGFIENAIKIYSHGGKLTSAEHIPLAVHALNEAIIFVTKDKSDYAQTKLDAVLTKHSD